jgi:hypothetical protein
MATDMDASMEAGPVPNDDVVVGDARPADGSCTVVERRFRVSDTNRNGALKSMGEEGNAWCDAFVRSRKRHTESHGIA